jgi:hypothetical protein
MAFLAVVAGIVAALIMIGTEPYFALSAAGTIAFIARDMWMPGGGGVQRGTLPPRGDAGSEGADGGGES